MGPNKMRVASMMRALVLVTSIVGATALAQGTSVLTGTVNDASSKQPVADVVVTATSPSLQGEQVVVTDAAGLYRIPNLPSGSYTIRLEKESYKPYTRGDINVRSDRTIRVNVELLPEALKAEEITVVGRAPVIDVGSTNTGTNVGKDFMENIALVRPGGKNAASRSFESLAEVAPGAQSDAYGVSVNGTTSPENQFVIDGLSVNDPAYGILGTPLTVDFIQEVNVISGGYMPEYGRATGGIMNVVTKSGSNEFHGSVFGSWAPGSLAATSPDIKREGSVIQTKGHAWNSGDFGAEVGGPILKDKLWFFAGAAYSGSRYQWHRWANKIQLDANNDPVVDDKGFTQVTKIDGTDAYKFADQRGIQYIGKLTYLVSQDHNLSLSVYGNRDSSGSARSFGYDPQVGRPDGPGNAPFTTSALAHTANANDVLLKWSSAFMDKHVLVDATFGWHHQEFSNLPVDGSGLNDTDPKNGTGLASDPSVRFRRTNPHSLDEFAGYEWAGQNEIIAACNVTDANGVKLNNKVCPMQTYAFGGPGFIDKANLNRYQAKIVGTLLAQALGHHVVKGGIDVEMMDYDHTKAYTGTYVLRESRSGTNFADYRQFGYLTGPDQAVIQNTQRALSTSVTSGGFLQDSWSVLDLFTLNAGVRYDQQTIYGADKAVGAALNNEISPRVGLIYDFTQQGRSKIYANYAKFYEGMPLDIADRSFPGERQLNFYRARTPGTSAVTGGPRPGCDPLKDYNMTKNECREVDPATGIPVNALQVQGGTEASQFVTLTGGDKVPVDPNLQPQASSEILVGGEYEVIADGRVGVTYTKRWLDMVIEDMSRDEANTYFIGNPGYGMAADFPKATRDYNAVTLYFNKSFSDLWLGSLSYTYSTLYGNYAGLYRPETGQLDPNINSDFDLRSLLPNRSGPLPGDTTHSIKMYGAKEFVVASSFSVNLGLSYLGHSGSPISYLASHQLYGPGEVFVLPRGSGGYTPWVHRIDGRLAATYRITKDNALTVSADVFNLLNFQGVTGVDETFTNSDVLPVTNVPAGKTPQQAICIEGSDASCKSVLVHSDGSPVDQTEINPNFKNVTAYQSPRSVRFGLKVTF